MDRNHLLGIGFGVLAGALWGLVFLAPNLTPDFSAVEISAGPLSGLWRAWRWP